MQFLMFCCMLSMHIALSSEFAGFEVKVVCVHEVPNMCSKDLA